MATKHLTSLAALNEALQQDMQRLHGRAVEATHRAADLGRLVAFSKAPVAFGELRDGIIDEPRKDGASITSTAPYSMDVEVGARPHWPPLQPILDWVRLRGTQGLDVGEGAIGHADRVASEIRSLGDGTSTPVDAAVIVANRIRGAIAKHGTKPTWFMRESVPEVMSLLDAFMQTLLRDPL